ncbi:MAG: hypothetical protein M3P29_03060 [Acidobacteriota bacterium]|nr:hypothetical protein [Acidobacteriota bacterium]
MKLEPPLLSRQVAHAETADIKNIAAVKDGINLLGVGSEPTLLSASTMILALIKPSVLK